MERVLPVCIGSVFFVRSVPRNVFWKEADDGGRTIIIQKLLQNAGMKKSEKVTWTEIPVCLNCGKLMKPFIATKGRFKGKWGGHEWTCQCMHNLVACIG